MIGKKVKLTKKMARWLINNQEFCHGIPGYEFLVDDSYDSEMWLCIMVMMDCPPAGIVKKKGLDCWGVEFNTPFGKELSYYDRKDLVLA